MKVQKRVEDDSAQALKAVEVYVEKLARKWKSWEKSVQAYKLKDDFSRFKCLLKCKHWKQLELIVYEQWKLWELKELRKIHFFVAV